MSVESELFDSISQTACVNNRPKNAGKEKQKTSRASGISCCGWGRCLHTHGQRYLHSFY